MTRRDILLLELASILDHPSVYMGGPSWTNKEKAGRILKYLEKEDVLRITEQLPGLHRDPDDGLPATGQGTSDANGG